MRVKGRFNGAGRARAGFGLAAVAVVWAVSAIAPNAAGASPGASPGGQGDRAAPASSGAGMSLSQAPPALRAAVQKTLGAGAQSPAAPVQQAELTASDSTAGDNVARSVAVSGSTAVVGAPFHNNRTGAAYVFVQSGTTWTQQAELTASDGALSDLFGYSVAISGSTVMVDAPYHNSTTGAVYVFVRSGTTWSQQAELTNGVSGDEFGRALAMSGSTALIGAPYHSSSTGVAYVFVRSGATWTQQAKLKASDGAQGDYFGLSLAVQGSTAVVGAPYRNTFTGAAYIFARSGTKWIQRAALTAADGAQGDYYGTSVAVSGTIALVSAPPHNIGAGAVYVYAHSGGTWSLQTELTASDGARNDNFGFSLAMPGATGSTVLIGAPFHNSDTGVAYLFARSGSTWSQNAELTASDGTQGDDFGYSVGASNGIKLIGAPFRNSATGAAYVFAKA